MTDDQINKAIAKACMWTKQGQHGVLYKTAWGWEYNCPDFCADLNAMHEAEDFLRGNEFQRYAEMLDSIIGSLGGIRAIARERAEAFLRTLGKWEAVKESLTTQPTTEDSSVVGKEVQP